MLLCVLHKLVIGFAVVGVINGVFIQAVWAVMASSSSRERFTLLHAGDL